jgi:hypothetical protein
MRFARAAGSADLRTVVFVNRKDSAEKYAREFEAGTNGLFVGHRVPPAMVPRLQLELGRPSIIAETMPRGALPHHAGLTRLEQHLVEQFLQYGYAATVVATPTLAQGVNLPLDMSIVTFLTRFNLDEGEAEPIDPSELHNMLGRAGRAGMVPDGVCLIAVDQRTGSQHELLRANRPWLYPPPQTAQVSGVIRLLQRLEHATSRSANWLLELDVITWSDAQSILSFGAGFALDPTRTAAEQLTRFPSFAALPSTVQTRLAAPMSRLVGQLQASGSARVIGLMAKTGLPLQFVQHVVASVEAASVIDQLRPSWWDDLVRTSLGWMRPWCHALRVQQSVEEFMHAVNAWRSGLPVSAVEDGWHTAERLNAHRVKSGQFFNSSIGQAAQLWGIAPLALAEFGLEDIITDDVKGMGAFVREGVPTIDALLWLRALGGLDRVLATKLAAISTFDAGASTGDRIRAAEEQLADESPLWVQLDDETKAALRAVVEERDIVAQGIHLG